MTQHLPKKLEFHRSSKLKTTKPAFFITILSDFPRNNPKPLLVHVSLPLHERMLLLYFRVVEKEKMGEKQGSVSWFTSSAFCGRVQTVQVARLLEWRLWRILGFHNSIRHHITIRQHLVL